MANTERYEESVTLKEKFSELKERNNLIIIIKIECSECRNLLMMIVKSAVMRKQAVIVMNVFKQKKTKKLRNIKKSRKSLDIIRLMLNYRKETEKVKK